MGSFHSRMLFGSSTFFPTTEYLTFTVEENSQACMAIIIHSQRRLLFYGVLLLLEWSYERQHRIRVGAFIAMSSKRTAANSHRPPIEIAAVPDQQQDQDRSVQVNRRRMMIQTAAASAMALNPALASASTTTTTPTNKLQDIAIGQGVWTSLDALSSASTTANPKQQQQQTTFTATFATYLTRFLIQFDPAVKTWWQQLNQSYYLIPPDQRQQQLGLAFGSLAKSIQQAFQTTTASSADLYTRFIETYGEIDPSARRQISILFSLLPPQDQPLTLLDSYLKNEETIKAKQTLTRKLPKLNRQLPSQPRTTTTLFGDDLSRLLPEVFHITKVTASTETTIPYYYTIEPTVTLYEIGIGQEFGQTAVATAFGPMASTPLVRDRPQYSAQLYGLFGVAGATACCLTHATVIPLDVVKTRAQTNDGKPSSQKNMLSSAISIAEREGVSALFLGAQATLAGYFWYGLSVYPSYTFSKRSLLGFLPPDFGVAHANEVALAAGALAAVVASLGLTPLEAARIRVVADPAAYRPLGLVGTLKIIANENQANAITNLYAGLPSLLARQVIFGSVKFLAFERACELIFAVSPGLHDATWTTLSVSLVAGGISGILSSVVSQPADSLLTYVAKGGTNMGLIEGARTMVMEDGPGSLFRGLGSRCVWAGSIIAGQFLLYDLFRTAFGINSDNLSQVFQLQV